MRPRDPESLGGDHLLIRGWFFAEWKRLWPWDLWGPFGPWGRVQAVINPIIEVIASAVVQVAKSIASIVSRR